MASAPPQANPLQTRPESGLGVAVLFKGLSNRRNPWGSRKPKVGPKYTGIGYVFLYMGVGQNQRFVTGPGPTLATCPSTKGM